MTKIVPDVVIDVARDCYSRLDRLQPGSEDAEIAEHAVSLVLSERRPTKPKDLLLNDVLRNARHSVRRSRARYVQAVEESGHLAARDVATGATRGFVERETPEDICIANELGQILHAEACRCGRHGPRVLEGLLGGEPNHTIAAAAGVSMSTLNRTVRHLRKTVVELGYQEAA
jgi:hypothetical protein